MQGAQTAAASTYARTYEMGDELPGEYRELLLHLLEAHNENFGSEWYRNHLKYLFDQAMDLAPDPESRFRMAQFLGDEATHGWMFYTLTREMGVDTSAWGIKLKVFDDHLQSWPDYVFFNALGDLAGTYQATQMANSSFLPLARVGKKVERDEWGHSKMGELHLKNLCATPEGKAQAQEALKRWWPVALDMFGFSNSKRNERYRYWGIKQQTNGELRERFRKHARPMLERNGLVVPDDNAGRKTV